MKIISVIVCPTVEDGLSDCHESLSFGNNPENFAKFHLVFQKLDHLTCNAILRKKRNEVNGFIHVIEERHK